MNRTFRAATRQKNTCKNNFNMLQCSPLQKYIIHIHNIHSYLYPQSFIHHGHFLLSFAISFCMDSFCFLSMATREGRMEQLHIFCLLVKSNILSIVQPTTSFWAGAVETIKPRSIHKRCWTPFCFKETSETAMFSLHGITTVLQWTFNTDIIFPSTINHG